ncbi:MAG TPA: flagellar export chaperone FliS [Holophaga sp.]|nr:flagellar export chaperone FliS [Holophaga sp.]
MNPTYGGTAANQYLVQQINGASPERLMFMLLEGAQKFLLQAIAAIQRRDIATRARMVNRVSSIVEELAVRLNHEEGGELVDNLTRLYDWWLKELFEASQHNQADRLQVIERQIADMKVAWAEVDQRQNAAGAPMLSPQGLVG